MAYGNVNTYQGTIGGHNEITEKSTLIPVNEPYVSSGKYVEFNTPGVQEGDLVTIIPDDDCHVNRKLFGLRTNAIAMKDKIRVIVNYGIDRFSTFNIGFRWKVEHIPV